MLVLWAVLVGVPTEDRWDEGKRYHTPHLNPLPYFGERRLLGGFFSLTLGNCSMRCSTFYFHVVVTLSVLAPASLSIAVPDAILPSPSMESYLLRLLYIDVRMPRWTDAMERPCSRPDTGEGILAILDFI